MSLRRRRLVDVVVSDWQIDCWNTRSFQEQTRGDNDCNTGAAFALGSNKEYSEVDWAVEGESNYTMDDRVAAVARMLGKRIQETVAV